MSAANRGYSWSGWHEGADVEPPEPGKEWLTIEEHGEEYAIIVLRTDASVFVNDPEALERARLERERRAQRVTDALNGWPS